MIRLVIKYRGTVPTPATQHNMIQVVYGQHKSSVGLWFCVVSMVSIVAYPRAVRYHIFLIGYKSPRHALDQQQPMTLHHEAVCHARTSEDCRFKLCSQIVNLDCVEYLVVKLPVSRSRINVFIIIRT